MKKIIIDIGKSFGIDLTVTYLRREFDIHGYEIVGENFLLFDEYFSGKTNTGVEYQGDKERFLYRITKAIKTHAISLTQQSEMREAAEQKLSEKINAYNSTLPHVNWLLLSKSETKLFVDTMLDFAQSTDTRKFTKEDLFEVIKRCSEKARTKTVSREEDGIDCSYEIVDRDSILKIDISYLLCK